MAQAVNLVDEFDDPPIPKPFNVEEEFDPPPARDREAITVDAHDKIKDWNSAFHSSASPEAGFDLVKKWAGEKAASAFKENASNVFEEASTPLIHLPRANVPRLENTPASMRPMQPTASVLAGAYNTAAGFAESMTTPFNIGTLGTFGALSKVAQGTGPAARAAQYALSAIKVGFGAEMAHTAGGQAGKASVDLADPNKSLQEKVESGLAPLVTGGLAIISAAHGAKDVMEIAEPARATNPNSVAEVSAKVEPARPLTEDFLAPEVMPDITERLTPETAKLEAASGGPEKLATIKAALKRPETVIQYSVWDRDMIPEGRDRVAQVDLIDPNDKQSVGGIASTNRALLAEQGIDVPPAPESLAPGRYTLDEIKAAIAKEAQPSEIVRGDNFDKAWEAGGKQAGSENQIVVENGRVYKRNYNAGLDQAFPNHGTLEAFNENLAIHNEIFPETALKFEGMSETPAGPAPVVSQVEVKGVEATKPEIDAFMAAKGFEPYSNSAYVNKEAGLRVGDLKGDNVIKDANGVLHVIDPVIKRIEPEPATVGLGAASPDEFRPIKESAVSLKNEAVDAERKARGAKPLMEVAKKGFGEVWDQAMKRIDENQNVADDLIARLKEKPSAITDVDQAILLHREIDLKNQLDRVTNNLAEQIGTEDSLISDRLNRARILDELSDLETVSREAGTETSRGLNARKLIAKEDYSLAKMLTERRADRGGAKLTEEEIAEVKKQHDEIEEAQRALDQHEAQQELDDAISTPAEAEAQIKKLEKENQAEDKKPKPAPRSKEEVALKQFKTRTQKRIDDLRKKIEAGDFSKKAARKPVELDQEALRLKAELRRAKDKFQETLLKDRLAKRTLVEKTQDTLVKWRRGFLLSSPVTLLKLTSAAMQRMTFTPLEELVGAGIGKAIPKIASRAPREGGLNVTAEARAITEGLTKGMSDAAELMKTGKTNLEVLFGKGREGGVKESDVTPRSVIDFFGQVHGALKAPVKRAEFSRSLEKRMAFAIKNGVDVADPMVQTRLMVEAYRDANRSIFLQDNIVVSAYNRAIGALLEKQKATGNPSTAGKAIATTAKVLLPIVRVPTNIVAETIQTATGTLTGSYRLARTLGRAAKDISPDEADLVLRDLKKGSLGAALILVGYFNAKNIGGYYQSGQKRGDKDVPYASVKIGGVTVPSYLLHNPLMETLQIGATIRRVAESKLLKKDKDPQGLASGVFAAALGLAEEVPFVRQQVETAKMLDTREGPYARGEFVKSLAVPSLVDWIARQTDKDAKGEVIQRKPATVLQHIETGIPGLRPNVPARSVGKQMGQPPAMLKK